MTVRLELRRMLAIATAIALAVAGVLFSSPTSSRGEQRAQTALGGEDFWNASLRYAGEFSGFRIAAAAGVNDQLSISYLETPSPDFLFVSPGGIASPPPPCIAASFTVVRCPATGATNMDVLMGPGSDFIESVNVSGPSVSGFRLKVTAGPGKDRWLGGPLGEIFSGGPGSDVAEGQEGIDKLLGGAGNDKLRGGPGNDRIDCGPGNHDLGVGGPGRDLGSNCEKVKH